MKPDNKPPVSFYMVAAGVAAQVGCLVTGIVGGSLGLGLLLDRVLNTRPIFIFLLLLGSIPLNLWLIYKYTIYRTKQLQAPSTQTKEEEKNTWE